MEGAGGGVSRPFPLISAIVTGAFPIKFHT